MPPLLEVKNLETHFFTQDGVVKAVNNVSFHVDKGETLGIVGESGSGKSVTSLALMGLIPLPPGQITSGEARFQSEALGDVTYSSSPTSNCNRYGATTSA